MVPRARTFVDSATQPPVLGRPGLTTGFPASFPVGVGTPGAVGWMATVGSADGLGVCEALGGVEDVGPGAPVGPGLGAESLV